MNFTIPEMQESSTSPSARRKRETNENTGDQSPVESPEEVKSNSSADNATEPDPIELLCSSNITEEENILQMMPAGGLCRIQSYHFENLYVSTNESTVHVPVNIYDRGEFI